MKKKTPNTYDENLPATVDGEKVTQEVEIFPLPCGRPTEFLFHCVRINSFDKKMPA